MLMSYFPIKKPVEITPPDCMEIWHINGEMSSETALSIKLETG